MWYHCFRPLLLGWCSLIPQNFIDIFKAPVTQASARFWLAQVCQSPAHIIPVTPPSSPPCENSHSRCRSDSFKLLRIPRAVCAPREEIEGLKAKWSEATTTAHRTATWTTLLRWRRTVGMKMGMLTFFFFFLRKSTYRHVLIKNWVFFCVIPYISCFF